MSSSVLVATYLNASQSGKGATGGGKQGINGEVEKGLVTLISSDNPGLQVPFFCLKQTYCCIMLLYELNHAADFECLIWFVCDFFSSTKLYQTVRKRASIMSDHIQR